MEHRASALQWLFKRSWNPSSETAQSGHGNSSGPFFSRDRKYMAGRPMLSKPQVCDRPSGSLLRSTPAVDWSGLAEEGVSITKYTFKYIFKYTGAALHANVQLDLALPSLALLYLLTLRPYLPRAPLHWLKKILIGTPQPLEPSLGCDGSVVAEQCNGTGPNRLLDASWFVKDSLRPTLAMRTEFSPEMAKYRLPLTGKAGSQMQDTRSPGSSDLHGRLRLHIAHDAHMRVMQVAEE
ncbi:hypothetical protein PG997_007667 [Apiospora hydei]|uniref:Uncharacterized protein n=1 Tax=Apiospora hydei TaxID=1337664 RepID=A0ABR1WCG1_9PEZI